MNVLIVDDSPEVVRSMQNNVDWKSLGIERIFTAYNVRSAKNILLTESVEILLCDVEMPEEDGFSLLRWCREENKQIQCIFCSAYANFSYAQKALHMGSFDYILQPAPPEEIEAAVRKAIERIDLEQARLTGAEQWPKRRSLLLDACVSRYLSGEEMETSQFFEALASLDIAIEPDTAVEAVLSQSRKSDALLCASLPENNGYLCVYPSENGIPAKELRNEVWRQIRVKNAHGDPVSNAVSYIRSNIEKELRRSDVAEAVFVNPDHLSRLFKREKGVSLTEFILQEKMRTAAKLLRETNVSISLVAGKVGFTNFSYFSQSFKKFYGKAPTEYRASFKRE